MTREARLAPYLYAGIVAEVQRKLDELVETANPEYFCWDFDQRLLPLEVTAQQPQTLGEQILPYYR